MAYNLVADDATTFREHATEAMPSDDKARASVIRLWACLREKYEEQVNGGKEGYKNPIALQKGTKTVKLWRGLQGKVAIKSLKSECELDSKLKVEWGNGSRGNTGVNNAGTAFEIEMQEYLLHWLAEGTAKKGGPYAQLLDRVVKEYGLDDCTAMDVLWAGPENKPRPIALVNGHWHVGSAKPGDYDIGETVTDVTVEWQDESSKTPVPIYFSCKTSGTTTMSNLGIKRCCFIPAELAARNITTDAGKALLRTFGLDMVKTCEVFIDAHATFAGKDSPSKEERMIPKRESEVTTSAADKNLLGELIKGSIGHGYHYCHLHNNKINNFNVTKNFCDSAAVVSSVKVYYGGKSGRGQRIDIEVVTPEITFMFNIRDTTGKGKGWPDKLQSGYKFKGEDVFTCAWDVDEDASAGSVQRSSSGKKVSGGKKVKQGDLHG